MTITTLKLFAMFAMTLDHLWVFIPDSPYFFHWIGRLAAPIFLFCCVEGYIHTSSKKKFFMNIYSLSIFVDTMNLILGINEVRMNFIRTILLTLTIIFIIDKFKEKNIPYIVVMNKLDLVRKQQNIDENEINSNPNTIWVSSTTKENIYELKEMIAKQAPTDEPKFKIVGDLLNPSDFVVLVVPIDKAAPKGRLILPQQQTIRDILEANANAIVVKENELKNTLKNLGKKPKLVITDSQVFSKVSTDTPKDILLTSFSILFARYKGDLKETVKGVKTLEDLKDNDTILISEGCTHHRQCDDIGTVKIPKWITKYTNKKINFEFSTGREFPYDLSKYKMIVHCGGCTLNEREMKYRVKCAQDQNIPFTNYGILIAYTQGILKRTLEPFSDISCLLEK